MCRNMRRGTGRILRSCGAGGWFGCGVKRRTVPLLALRERLKACVDRSGRTSMAGLARAAALILVVLMSSGASAQTYPSKTVKIIVPFGAGGPADVYARVVAQHLSENLKQNFVVEDRPGAGSIIGTNEVAKSAPDGYTLLLMSNTHTTNESLIP